MQAVIQQDQRQYMSQILILVMGLVLLCASASSHALALGEPELKSHLNEPLKALIPITSLTVEEFKTLDVRNGSAKLYRQFGVPYSKTVKALKVRIIGDERQRYLELSTPGHVREPLLDIVLQVNTGNGQLLRSFTLLLQPRRL